MGRYNIFTSLGWGALGVVIVIIVAICCCFACSFPFLQQVVNPTFTAQIQTPQGSIDVQIPAELSDFVTEKAGFTIPLAGNICLLQFPGVRTDPEGRIIDHYEFIIKCDTYKILALKATVMDTEKYWIYLEGIPIPATHDQLKDKIETLTGGKAMEISIGYYTLPAILMVILGIIYKSVPAVPGRWKPAISVGVGMLLGIGAMLYSEQPVTPKLVIEYLLLGLMGGAASTGLYEGQKAITNPRE